MDVVQLLCQMRWQSSVAVACKEEAGAASQHSFVCCHPLHAKIVRNGQHFFRDAAFRGPNPFWTDSEYLLVQIETAHKLFARIFGMTETVLWQRQSGR